LDCGIDLKTSGLESDFGRVMDCVGVVSAGGGMDAFGSKVEIVNAFGSKVVRGGSGLNGEIAGSR
jgi:hypothetical protein